MTLGIIGPKYFEKDQQYSASCPFLGFASLCVFIFRQTFATFGKDGHKRQWLCARDLSMNKKDMALAFLEAKWGMMSCLCIHPCLTQNESKMGIMQEASMYTCANKEMV